MVDLQNCVVCDVIKAATVYSPKGRFHQMRDREMYGLSLCKSGEIVYTQNGKSYVSDKDHVVILPEGGTYTISGTATGEFPVINFTCRDVLCNEITLIKVKNYEGLLSDYEQMRKLSAVGGNRARLLSIFYHMIDLLQTESCPSILLPAVRYLEANYTDPNIQNAVLASECKISEVYFRKLFTQSFRVSPRQYLIDLRIRKAEQLLTEGTMKTVDIAEACGFSGAYHFSRLFKRYTGKTPSAYRSANRILNP